MEILIKEIRLIKPPKKTIARFESLLKIHNLPGNGLNAKRIAAMELLLDREELIRGQLPDDLLHRLVAYVEKTGEKADGTIRRFLDGEEATFDIASEKLKGLVGMTCREIGEELYIHPIRDAGKLRATVAVQEIMTANDVAKEWYEKFFITSTSVTTYATSDGGRRINSGAVASIVGTPTVHGTLQEEIAAHHKSHALDTAHNAKAARERRKHMIVADGETTKKQKPV